MAKKLKGSAKVFAENLKHYRNRAGLSQTEVAQRLDIAVATVSGWETGKKPQFTQIDALAELYGVNPQDFFVSREAPKKIMVETDSDFAECIWALVRSRYVIAARTFPSASKPDAGINLRLDISEAGQHEDSSGLMTALSVILKVLELGDTGQLPAYMADDIVLKEIKHLKDKR